VWLHIPIEINAAMAVADNAAVKAYLAEAQRLTDWA
jgi:hypothetical protein